MATASTHALGAQEAIESVELPTLALALNDALPKSTEPTEGRETASEVVVESEARRGTFRTFTVMLALFMSSCVVFHASGLLIVVCALPRK